MTFKARAASNDAYRHVLGQFATGPNLVRLLAVVEAVQT